MDDLVQRLLSDLSHNLDRLADELDAQHPTLAKMLRRESRGVAPEDDLRAAEPGARRPRRAALRPVLYRALESGALGASKFDRLMLLTGRAARR